MLRNILEKIIGATTGYASSPMMFDCMVKDWESALVLSWYVYSFTVDDHENMLCFRDADINVLKKKKKKKAPGLFWQLETWNAYLRVQVSLTGNNS